MFFTIFDASFEEQAQAVGEMIFDEPGLIWEERQHVRQVASHRTRDRRPGPSTGPGSALLLCLWNIVGHDDADALAAKPDSALATLISLRGPKLLGETIARFPQ